MVTTDTANRDEALRVARTYMDCGSNVGVTQTGNIYKVFGLAKLGKGKAKMDKAQLAACVRSKGVNVSKM